jgi:hypothetical protein
VRGDLAGSQKASAVKNVPLLSDCPQKRANLSANINATAAWWRVEIRRQLFLMLTDGLKTFVSKTGLGREARNSLRAA